MDETICIIGALNEEIVEIRRQMTVEDSAQFGPASAFAGIWQGRRIVLARSGVGQKHARAALEKACERFPVSRVISIGYAGGLVPELRIGDIVIADKVLELTPAMQPRQTDARWAEQAMQVAAAIKLRRGGLLTVDKTVMTPDAKRALGSRYDVAAVEMETAALLKLADEKRLPFLSVRCITDTVEHELVDFSTCYNASGGISKLKAAWHILTHPETIPRVFQLRDHARTATQNLTRYLEKLLTLPGV